jgi:hypothetical protein
MTENQWPRIEEPAADQYPSAGTVPPSAVSGGSSSKKDVAKEEAAAVSGQAADAAQNVAETAKAEAANVASEVKSNARDLLHQAKSDLTSQAGIQQQKAAEGIRTISSQLSTMAEAPEQQGIASDLIRQAADRSASVASWLENRDPGSLLNEVQSFARQRPGAFLLIAAGAGILAGRLGRSLQAGAPATPGTAPKLAPPVSQPSTRPNSPRHQETVIAAGAGDRFFDEPTVPAVAGPASTRTLPAGTAADTSLRADSAPFPGVEGRHL